MSESKKKRSDQRPQYLKSHKFEILAILPLAKAWISSYQDWVFLTFTYLIWPVLLNICCCPWPYPDKMSLITLHRLPADKGLHFIWCPGTRVDNMLWKIKGNTVWHIHHTNILYSIWYFNNHFFYYPINSENPSESFFSILGYFTKMWHQAASYKYDYMGQLDNYCWLIGPARYLLMTHISGK